MSVVTPALINQVAFLARLQLEGQALAQLATQLDGILQYVQQLQAIPTAHVQPTSHVLPLANVLRPDEPRPSLPTEVVLALAPSPKSPFVRVPKVIEA